MGGTAESHEKLRYANGFSEPELYDLRNDPGEKNQFSKSRHKALRP